MRTSRTTRFALATALSFGSILGLAHHAGAETPHQGPGTIVMANPGGDPQPTPGDISTGDDTPDLPPPPAPQPQPQPQGPGDLGTEVPQPDPDPAPKPEHGPGDITNPDQDPECDPKLGPCDITNPEGQPECDPKLGPCDIANPEADPECDPKLASCDLTSADPDDGDETPQPDDAVEVESESESRTALPFTGSESMVLGAAGVALIGAGTGFRRLARR